MKRTTLRHSLTVVQSKRRRVSRSSCPRRRRLGNNRGRQFGLGLKNVENNGGHVGAGGEEGATAARRTYHVVVPGRIQDRFPRPAVSVVERQARRKVSVDVATGGGGLFVGCFREQGQDSGPAGDVPSSGVRSSHLSADLCVGRCDVCVSSAMWRRRI